METIENRTIENFVFLNRDWLKRCDGEKHSIGYNPNISTVKRAKYMKYAIEYGLLVYDGKSNLRGKTDYVLTEKGKQMLEECGGSVL